eukprot:349632-Chlamydomonas_euryale.AAC.7
MVDGVVDTYTYSHPEPNSPAKHAPRSNGGGSMKRGPSVRATNLCMPLLSLSGRVARTTSSCWKSPMLHAGSGMVSGRDAPLIAASQSSQFS